MILAAQSPEYGWAIPQILFARAHEVIDIGPSRKRPAHRSIEETM